MRLRVCDTLHGMSDQRNDHISKQQDVLRRMALNKVAASETKAVLASERSRLAALEAQRSALCAELLAVNAELSRCPEPPKPPKPPKMGKKAQALADRNAAIEDMYRRHAAVPWRTMTVEQCDDHNDERLALLVDVETYYKGVEAARAALAAAAALTSD